MDRYTKAFVVASLVYFLLGSVLGILVSTSATFASYQFTHVHLNLLGFMAMMIYGVGYFILPRFNARSLRWPGLVALHFYVANIGLIGMCLFRQLDYASASTFAGHGFVTFAAIEVLSVFLFVVNMVATLASSAVQAQRISGAAPGGVSGRAPGGVTEGDRGGVPGGVVGGVAGGVSGTVPVGRSAPAHIEPSMRVGEILERYPGTRMIMANAGIRALASEAHAEQVKRMPVTLQTACMKHGVDLRGLIEELESFIANGGGEPSASEAASPVGSTYQSSSASHPASAERNGITAEMNIGEVLARYPQTRPVFLEYFGSGCFDCPGQAMENIGQGALMHNVEASELLGALNRAIGR